MPLLRDGRAVAGEPRTPLADDRALPETGLGAISVPLGRFLNLNETEAARVEAVWLAADDDVQTLTPAALARLALIEIDFAAYTDGRGYSHARRLRRQGFAGELRAVGDVRLDQLLFMARSGIDGAALAQPIEPRLLRETLSRFSHAYQPSYPLPEAAARSRCPKPLP